MNCKPGQLLLIPFPYSDISSIKKRPVLALTRQDRHGDFIALRITTVMQKDGLALDDQSLAQGALPKPSWIRMDKVFTLSSGSVVRDIGAVRAEILAQALEGLCRTVGFRRVP